MPSFDDLDCFTSTSSSRSTGLASDGGAITGPCEAAAKFELARAEAAADGGAYVAVMGSFADIGGTGVIMGASVVAADCAVGPE